MTDIDFNEAYKRSAPHPFALVTSLDRDGKANALAVSWVMKTSIKPFLMLISIDHKRYSHDGIDFHKEFVINYPSIEHRDGALICGTKSGRDCDKISEAGFKLAESVKISVPAIEGVSVAMECKVVDKFETGDHTVFVGEVLHTRANKDKEHHLFAGYPFKAVAIDPEGIIKN